MSDRPPAVDLSALDRLLDMTGGDVEFLDELVDTYLEDAPGQLAQMRAAAANGAQADLVRPAHSLKSNSANMGAESLAGMCRVLEDGARDGVADDATAQVEAIEAEFQQVRRELLAARETR